MNKNEFTLLWPFYVTALFSGSVSVALPVWIILLEQNFSFFHISVALSLQCLGGILFEIPTGAVADVLGRKLSVIIGIALQGLVWLTLPLVDGYPLLYGAFFFMGALRTLESGADVSWVVDWLKANRRKDLVDGMFAKMKSLRATGRVAGCLLSSALLLCWDVRFLFFVQGGGYLVESLILLCYARETFRHRRTRVSGLVRRAVLKARDGGVFILGSKPLILFVLASACLTCSVDFGCIAWQPALVQLSLPPRNLGIVFALAGSLGIVAPLFARRLTTVFRSGHLLLAGTALIDLVVLSLLFWIEAPLLPAGMAIFLCAGFIADLQSPVASSLFHSFIPGRIRATVASAQSTVCAIASCATTALGGYAMDVAGARNSIVLLSLLLIPGSIFFVMSAPGNSTYGLNHFVRLWAPPGMFILPLCVPRMGTFAPKCRCWCHF